MSTRNLRGDKWRPARKADNLTVNCEQIAYKMWGPRRLTTIWAFATCYGIALLLLYYYVNLLTCYLYCFSFFSFQYIILRLVFSLAFVLYTFSARQLQVTLCWQALI
jgi:hypothetical protein